VKVVVYGAGNQDLYVRRLNLPERFGGTPPYGGARMAIEFAQAGYETWLAEPNESIMDKEHWDAVKEAGVKVTNDDVEAAKNADVAILFTPFGKTTPRIVKTILPHLPQNAVIATTCTMPQTVLYDVLYITFRKERQKLREDVGFSTMHPAGVPGTPQHEHYVIATATTDGRKFASDEQIDRLVELSKAAGKKPYLVPADIAPAVADMGVLITAVTLAGILDYYNIARNVIGAPEKMVEQQILMSLQIMASLVETSGVAGLFKALNPEIVRRSAVSMHLLDDQKDLDVALEMLSNLSNIDRELLEKIEKAEIKPTIIVPLQRFINDVKRVVGENLVNGVLRTGVGGIKTVFWPWEL
jgi:H2-forming N(5),N(10)-methenyltetrahydromethanopterin dehydrogenase-like protein